MALAFEKVAAPIIHKCALKFKHLYNIFYDVCSQIKAVILCAIYLLRLMVFFFIYSYENEMIAKN